MPFCYDPEESVADMVGAAMGTEESRGMAPNLAELPYNFISLARWRFSRRYKTVANITSKPAATPAPANKAARTPESESDSDPQLATSTSGGLSGTDGTLAEFPTVGCS